MTPEPSVAFAARAPSKVSGMSSSSGPTNTPAAPPSRIGLERASIGDAAGELEQIAQRLAELALRRRPGRRDVAAEAE